MKRLIDFSSRFRILKGGKVSLVVSALIGSTTLSFAAPSGGVVTSGSANISSSGNTTNIIQNSGNVTINWDKFNIASNETVNFKQPNVNSIALNRVIGNEKSIINGALNANGQVWILNSNGVLFGKNAKINTAGLLATTKNLSDDDFNNKNYNFKGNSTESVINLGEIDISDSGYATLLANTVSNEGTIKAVKGSVRLIGADEVSINLNGNSIVDLTVDKGVLDSLVENKGAIYSDGGDIYLTTNAVNELLKGVVNNEGIIEANSLDGVTGFVELFAHGGEVEVGGTITAKEGFVETSGRDFTFNDAKIEAGEWLIDPVDITIDQSLADAIEIQLDSGNVTIETDANNNPDTTNNENADGGGDIFIQGNIEYTGMNDSSLTLKAYRNIIFGDSFTPTTKGSISSTNAALDVILWARAGGNNEGTDNRVGSVWLPQGSSISTNGGDVVIGGGQDALNGYTVGSLISSGENNSLYRGVVINGNILANGGDISIKGKAAFNDVSTARGVSIAGDSRVETSGTGNISIYGIAKGNSDAVAIGDTYFGSDTSGRGVISTENGNIYIQGLKGSGANSDAFFMSNESKVNSQNGSIIINGSETGDVKVATDSLLQAKTLFIYDANNVYLNNFVVASGHTIENIVGSNIDGEFNLINSGVISIGSFDYDNTIYNGLIANGDINLSSVGEGSSVEIDKNIYSISGNTLINGGDYVNVNSNISWDTQSKLTLKASTVNVKAEIKNTNSTNGGVYFDVLNPSSNVIFDLNGKVIIHNINQLQWMNTATKGNYKLGSNIDASVTSTWNDGKGWAPIENFRGLFDGSNYTIDGLVINRENEDSVGLFSSVLFSEIKNLNLKNFHVIGRDDTGALIGYALHTHIENVVVEDTSVVGNNNTGGLIGRITDAVDTVLNSHVINSEIKGFSLVGGLVGDSYFTNIINSSVQGGSVTGINPLESDNEINYAGGLVGKNNGNITNSYSTAVVSGYALNAGLVGENYGNIENSYSSGNISNGYINAGLVGLNNGNIRNSYSSGKVENSLPGEDSSTGGLVAYNNRIIENSFWDTENSGQTISAGGEGKTTAELQDINTFKKDIEGDWSIVEDSTINKGTPILSWQVNKDGESKPVWIIGTKVESQKENTSNLDKVITTIVNNEAVKVPNPPKVKTTTPLNSGSNTNVAFSVGENKQIVSKPIEGQATQRVTLSEAKQMQQETTGQSVDEVRVPLSRSSIIQLVDGGVSLPDGVEQEFYVANNEK